MVSWPHVLQFFICLVILIPVRLFIVPSLHRIVTRRAVAANPIYEFDPVKYFPDTYTRMYTPWVKTVKKIYNDCPIEFIHNGRLGFGNFVYDKPAGKTIKVRDAETGQNITIPAADIISCWTKLNDQPLPNTTAMWQESFAKADELIKEMEPRKQDLKEFWHIMKVLSNHSFVHSWDLGAYLFFEDKIAPWFNAEDMREICLREPMNTTHRIAAAKLLFLDKIHFKRGYGNLITVTEADLEEEYKDLYSFDPKYLKITEGYYDTFDEDKSLENESKMFVEYFEAVVKKEANDVFEEFKKKPYWLNSVKKQIRAIEKYSKYTIVYKTPKLLQRILSNLRKSPNIHGAQEVMEVLYKSTDPVALETFDKHIATPQSEWNQKLLEEVESMKTMMNDMMETFDSEEDIVRHGKREHLGRFDFRRDNDKYPAICIRETSQSTMDWAFSLYPEKSEILIHVMDVMSFITFLPETMSACRERLSTIVTPDGVIPCLHPDIIRTLNLSTEHFNKVISVALRYNMTDGSIIKTRVFPSVIGPVTPMTRSEADNIVSSHIDYFDEQDTQPASKDGDGGDDEGEQGAMSLGLKLHDSKIHSNAVYETVRNTSKILEFVAMNNNWLTNYSRACIMSSPIVDRAPYAMLTPYSLDILSKTPANNLVDSLLSIYSYIASDYCKDKVPMPLVADSMSYHNTTFIRRFGVSPLKHWMSLIQQKQIRGALRMEMNIKPKECIKIPMYFNSRKYDLFKKHYTGSALKGGTFHALESLVKHSMEYFGESPIFLAKVSKGNSVDEDSQYDNDNIFDDNDNDVKVDLLGYYAIKPIVENANEFKLIKNQIIGAKIKYISNVEKSCVVELTDIFLG